MALQLPYLGHGVGLRPPHFPRLWDGSARADWFEVISENYMIEGGRPLAALDRARAIAPVVLHGVSLSIGSADPLDRDYLRRLRALADRVEPAWISDHFCWTSAGGRHAHDLLPLPFTEEALGHVVARVAMVQEALGRQILLENVSSYVAFAPAELAEWECLAAVARRADCGLLLDVNNLQVNARNHGFDPYRYLAGLPDGRVGQIHLAGHTDMGAYLFDTHDGPVAGPVWDLYRAAVRRFGRVSTLIEWDERIPPLEEVCAEAARARAIEAEALQEPAHAAR
jgi:uncharacterized protein (UPF0276 family)